jgi:hypothetical protein
LTGGIVDLTQDGSNKVEAAVVIYKAKSIAEAEANEGVTVIGNNILCKSVIDFNRFINTKEIDKETVPAHSVVCLCAGCKDLNAGGMYKLECYNSDCLYQAPPQVCLVLLQRHYVMSCHELCGAYLCPKWHANEVVVDSSSVTFASKKWIM